MPHVDRRLGMQRRGEDGGRGVRRREYSILGRDNVCACVLFVRVCVHVLFVGHRVGHRVLRVCLSCVCARVGFICRTVRRVFGRRDAIRGTIQLGSPRCSTCDRSRQHNLATFLLRRAQTTMLLAGFKRVHYISETITSSFVTTCLFSSTSLCARERR